MKIQNMARRGLAIYFGSGAAAISVAVLYVILSKRSDAHLWVLAPLPVLYLTAIFGWFTYEFRT